MSALIVPTLNAGTLWTRWLQALSEQDYQPDYLLVIDSSSDDDTAKLAREKGFRVHVISRKDFNHGATRQLAVDLLPDTDILIFATQDAVFADRSSLRNLMACFSDNSIYAAYGRQLPHVDAGPIGAHARIFNYAAESQIKDLSLARQLGVKTAFISNSFAAYRRDRLQEVGGFPSNTIMSEDTYVAAKMILAGGRIAYCATACVYHSHDYTWIQEFKRYFDIGVFHARESWLRAKLGGVTGEGLRYVQSELTYLLRENPLAIPSALVRTLLKGVGYKLGTLEHILPVSWKKHLSMHKGYW